VYVNVFSRVEIAATVEHKDQMKRRRAGAVEPQMRLIAGGTMMGHAQLITVEMIN
jgi:hypothetical protein